jgi:hypothetical protein
VIKHYGLGLRIRSSSHQILLVHSMMLVIICSFPLKNNHSLIHSHFMFKTRFIVLPYTIIFWRSIECTQYIFIIDIETCINISQCIVHCMHLHLIIYQSYNYFSSVPFQIVSCFLVFSIVNSRTISHDSQRGRARWLNIIQYLR